MLRHALEIFRKTGKTPCDNRMCACTDKMIKLLANHEDLGAARTVDRIRVQTCEKLAGTKGKGKKDERKELTRR